MKLRPLPCHSEANLDRQHADRRAYLREKKNKNLELQGTVEVRISIFLNLDVYIPYNLVLCCYHCMLSFIIFQL